MSLMDVQISWAKKMSIMNIFLYTECKCNRSRLFIVPSWLSSRTCVPCGFISCLCGSEINRTLMFLQSWDLWDNIVCNCFQDTLRTIDWHWTNFKLFLQKSTFRSEWSNQSPLITSKLFYNLSFSRNLNLKDYPGYLYSSLTSRAKQQRKNWTKQEL